MGFRQAFEVWTVYDHPTDFPANFIARLYVGVDPTDQIIVTETLDALRMRLAEKGLTPVNRHPDDDANIVECWI